MTQDCLPMRAPTNRRHVLAGASAVAVSAAMGGRAYAQQPKTVLSGDVNEATLKPRAIAMPVFIGDDAQFAEQLTQVAANDLVSSGLFKIIDPRAYIEQIRDINQTPRYQDWRTIGAEALIVGRTFRTPEGRQRAEFRLWDPVLSKQLDGQGLLIAPQLWRRLAHQIADRVYEKMTLEKGYFDSQIVFVDETGPKARRIKRLTIMDQDGFGPRLLTDGKELSITPRFNPTSAEICFMQYQSEQPRVFLMNTETGQREPVPVPGLSYGPRFSPDGQKLVFTVSEGAAGSLVEMDLRSKQMRRLTQPQSIDTGASYAPDGRALVFESDREGTQQLYILDIARGGAIQRLSRGDGRYSTPVWSPRGDFIAFTKQGGGQFLIGVMRADGTGERILSSGFHNEGPTWAPNGRVIMFFREGQGATAGPRLFSVDLTGQNERQVPTPSFGSDPAWSPLRT